MNVLYPYYVREAILGFRDTNTFGMTQSTGAGFLVKVREIYTNNGLQYDTSGLPQGSIVSS